MEKIGLIAGNRKFPLLFCQEARKRGVYTVAVAVKKDTSLQINRLADKVYWVALPEYMKMFDIFKAEGIKRVVMAGQISPARLFSREVMNSRQIRGLLDAAKDNKPASIFSQIASLIENRGFELADSTLFMEDHLAERCIYTKRSPGEKEKEDIEFGLELARNIAALDIGQTVAVKGRAIVAVEGLEGTDNLIRRAGRLARAGMTVVKVSRPKHDMRFDIPVAGLRTIKTLIKAGASAFAMESKKTLFLDREECISLADKKGLIIAGV